MEDISESQIMEQLGLGVGSTALVAGLYIACKCLAKRFKRSSCKSNTACCEVVVDTEEEERQRTLHKESIKEVLIELGLVKNVSNNINEV